MSTSSGTPQQAGPSDMRKRIETVKDDLMSLHRELYWLVQGPNSPEQQQKVGELDFDQIMDLKLAVDNMRELLWKYVDAAAEMEPQRVQHAMESHRVRRVSQLLQLLRERLGHYSDPQQPVSFIEKMSAAIKEKLSGGDRAA